MRYLYLILTLSLIISNAAYAQKDPIGWEQSSNLPANTFLQEPYVVIYHFTNNLPFTLPTPLFITKETSSSNEFGFEDNCSGVKLTNGEICSVIVILRATSEGKKTFSLTEQYGRNVVHLPTLSTQASGNAPPPPEFPIVVGSTNNIGTGKENITKLGNSYTFEATFKNIGTAPVTATSITHSGTFLTIPPGQCTKELAPQQFCVVTGIFTPGTLGKVSLNVTYFYTDARGGHSVPVTQTTKVIKDDMNCDVTARVHLRLPTTTYIYADNVVQFNFRNNCKSAKAILDTFSLQASVGGAPVHSHLTAGSDTCSGKTLDPQQSCQVFYSIMPQNIVTGLLTVQGTLKYKSSNGGSVQTASAQTTSNLLFADTTVHNIIFINQCPFPVWFAFENNPGVGHGDPVLPPNNTPNDYLLGAQVSGQPPAMKVIHTPAYKQGKIWGRPNCIPQNGTLVCPSGTCASLPNSGTCQLGVKPSHPLTSLKADMVEQAVPPPPTMDNDYHITLVDGVNLAIEYKGLGPYDPTHPNEYTCGAAGAIIQPHPAQQTALGEASWLFDLSGITNPGDNIPFFNYVHGTSKGTLCSSNSDCPTGTLCGTGYKTINNNGGQTPFTRECNAFAGFWTTNNFLTASDPQLYDPQNLNAYLAFLLNTTLGVGPGAPGLPYGTVSGQPATYADIYGCNKTSNDSLESGYVPNSINVCGCHDWEFTPSISPGPCQEFNGDWGPVPQGDPPGREIVYPNIVWLKKAVPTAYSYPKDDATSKFICNPNTNSNGLTSYEIIYCPGGTIAQPAKEP